MTRNNLSTSNFDKKKIVKRILSVVLAVVLFACGCSALNYMYVQPDVWQHLMWHSYYSNKENIDNIFIGSSHVYADINPYILDDMNGMNNYNLSFGSLTLGASYMMLKEADRKNDLKNVYLELYYVPNTGEKGDIDTLETITNNWRALTYMRPSVDKYSFIFSMSGKEHYMESLIPFIRYRSKLFDKEYIKENFTIYRSDSWKNYEYTTVPEIGEGEYIGKGCFRSNVKMSERTGLYIYGTPVDLENEPLMTEKNQEILIKIINYCKKRKINITLFVSPMYETQILSAKNYDAYYKQVAEIAKENDVPFYDFNLCKSEYMDIMHGEFFKDNGHLNREGSDIFTKFLWSVVGEKNENKSYMFCDSYEEKIGLDEPEIYGVYVNGMNEGILDCTVASNRKNELIYRVYFEKKEGDKSEPIIVKDYSYEKKFLIPLDVGEGSLVIEAVNPVNLEIQTLKIN